MTQPIPVRSPCIRVCAVDPKTGFCQGCFRTLKEIAGWGRLTPEQRDEIMSRLPARRVAVPVPA